MLKVETCKSRIRSAICSEAQPRNKIWAPSIPCCGIGSILAIVSFQWSTEKYIRKEQHVISLRRNRIWFARTYDLWLFSLFPTMF